MPGRPLQRVTKNHVAMKCYGLGLGLDTFRMVALDANFRRLEEGVVASTYARWAQLLTACWRVEGCGCGRCSIQGLGEGTAASKEEEVG